MNALTCISIYLTCIAAGGCLANSSEEVRSTIAPTHAIRSIGGGSYDASGDGNYESTYDDEDGDDGAYTDDEYSYENYGSEGKDEKESVGVEGDYEEYEVPVDENDSEWDGFDGHLCGDGTRVGKRKICNGVRDCFDCSDEAYCIDTKSKFFQCYYGGEDAVTFTHQDPKCIPIHQFCDGVRDCANGVDEAQFGTGFKCAVKDRYRRCVLPDALLCDDIAHCEDRSDMCGNDVASPDPTTPASWISHEASGDDGEENSTYASASALLFRCLSDGRGGKSNRRISMHQVCDGEFDCEDLSDECLCEVPKSQIASKVCGGLCTVRLWSDQAEDANCEKCRVGEIYWGASVLSEDSDEDRVDKACYTPEEVITRIQLLKIRSLATPRSISERSTDALVEKNRADNPGVVECFDLTLTGLIRARKCDGRPECFFGEDECGIDCNGGGSQEWELGSTGVDADPSDPEFCSLLSPNFDGYTCKDGNVSKPSGLRNSDFFYYSPKVLLCDGVENCNDGSDEAFCAKKRSCYVGNETGSATYDISQECDGFAHCPNGADERPALCSKAASRIQKLPCMEGGEGESYFSPLNYLDGKYDCPTGADECPPFLNRVPEIQALFPEVDSSKKAGISSHDRAIDDLPLQIFLVAASFIGLSALAVSLALFFYNLIVTWARFTSMDIGSRDIWIRNCTACLREVVVNLSLTLSKALLCGYFAYIKITRSEDNNYSSIDLRWRASGACSFAGAVCFIGTQVPVVALFSFALLYWISRIFRRCCRTGKKNPDRNGGAVHRAQVERGSIGKGRGVFIRILLAFASVAMMVLIWVPPSVLAGLLAFRSPLSARTKTYAWVHIEGAPSVLRANLLDRRQAMHLGSAAVTLSGTMHNITNTGNPFCFPGFVKLLSTATPDLKPRLLGTYGYYGQSGACLPDFLVHTKNGVAPFDMAVSSDRTHAISLAIIIVDVVLVLVTMALVARYAEAIFPSWCRGSAKAKARAEKRMTLDSTFSACVAVEVLTWLLITSLYFLKTAVPEGFTNYAYTIWCMSVLGLNCGLITPFILLKRKFRLELGLVKDGSAEDGVIRSSDSKRIIEVNESDHAEAEEAKPLTNGDSANNAVEETPKEHSPSDKEEAAVSLV